MELIEANGWGIAACCPSVCGISSDLHSRGRSQSVPGKIWAGVSPVSKTASNRNVIQGSLQELRHFFGSRGY